MAAAKDFEERIKREGARKVAIFLLSIDQDLAARIMSNLEQREVDSLSIEIARTVQVSQKERDGVLEEFYNLIVAQGYAVQGGFAQARALLEKALPPDRALRAVELLENTIHAGPFNFLRKAESENLMTFIQEEHPQTIALIMSYVPAHQAADLLRGLPPEKQVEVIKRMATMENTNPEVIKQVEAALERKLSDFMTAEYQEVGGVQSVAEILNVVDRSTERTILEKIEEDDPELVDQIKRLMFVFEDIMLVNDRGIQAVLKEIDNAELALALKTASEELKNKIFRNMSARAADLVREEMEYLGPVRISDVEAAQQAIVNVVRRLEDSGDVIIQGRGGGALVV